MAATPEAVARDWFERVWNQGRESAIDELLAADARMHGLPTPDGKPIVGPAAFKPFYRALRMGALDDAMADRDRRCFPP